MGCQYILNAELNKRLQVHEWVREYSALQTIRKKKKEKKAVELKDIPAS